MGGKILNRRPSCCDGAETRFDALIPSTYSLLERHFFFGFFVVDHSEQYTWHFPVILFAVEIRISRDQQDA